MLPLHRSIIYIKPESIPISCRFTKCRSILTIQTIGREAFPSLHFLYTLVQTNTYSRGLTRSGDASIAGSDNDIENSFSLLSYITIILFLWLHSHQVLSNGATQDAGQSI